MVAPFPILGALLQLAGAPAAGEVATLLRSASALLGDGEPRKALVLLQRARSLDSAQSEVDVLANQCRSKLGMWVPSDTRAEWAATEDRLAEVVRARPDSMAEEARRSLEAEDIARAVGIYWLLSNGSSATPTWMNAYRDARSRQELKVAFHLELARVAHSRGLLSDADKQWRIAYTARPDDALLREKVDASHESMRSTRAMFEGDLRRRQASRDMAGALETLRRILVAFPGEERFRRMRDSLQEIKRVAVLKRIEAINAMVDAGQDQAAMDAMEELGQSDPQEPMLALAQESLYKRIQERRKRTVMDSLARVVEEALQQGDGGMASSVFDELQEAGMTDTIDARLRPRIDSLRSAERNTAVFRDAMSSVRRSLARKDVNAGRAGLQKALGAKPDNPVAKNLLVDLQASRAEGVSPKPAKPLPLDDESSRKVRELLLSGVIAYRAGEYENAMARWRQALELDPGNVQAQRYLANVGKKQARLK